MPKVVTNRPVYNTATADWMMKSPRNRLSYMVNNNPNGVIAFLQARGAAIVDVNHDGTIQTDELYAALIAYAVAKYGGLNPIQSFLDDAGNFIPHNDNAPRKWNIYL